MRLNDLSNNNVEAIKEYLSKREFVKYNDIYNIVAFSNYEIFKLFLEHKRGPDFWKGSGIMSCAFYKKCANTMKLLNDNGIMFVDQHFSSDFYKLANVEMLKFVMNETSMKIPSSCIHEIAKGDNVDLLKYVLDNSNIIDL